MKRSRIKLNSNFSYEDFYRVIILPLPCVQFFRRPCCRVASPSSNRPPSPSIFPSFSNPSNPLETNRSPSSLSLSLVDSRRKKKKKSKTRQIKAWRWIVNYEIYQVCVWSFEEDEIKREEWSKRARKTSEVFCFPRRKKRIGGNGGNEHGEPRPTFTKFSIASVDQPVEIYRSIDRPRDNLLSTNGFDVPLCEIIERVKRIESMDGLIVICIRFYVR